MAEKKRKAAGRQKWREWAESEEHQAVLSAWARAGMTDEEIAKQIGISRSTLAEWKKKYAPINAALATGKNFQTGNYFYIKKDTSVCSYFIGLRS